MALGRFLSFVLDMAVVTLSWPFSVLLDAVGAALNWPFSFLLDIGEVASGMDLVMVASARFGFLTHKEVLTVMGVAEPGGMWTWKGITEGPCMHFGIPQS